MIRFNRPYLIGYHIDIGPKFLGTLANLGQAFFLQVVLLFIQYPWKNNI